MANLTLMKKTWIFPLTLALTISLSLSGCGVRIDDGNGEGALADQTQVARYRASACQEAIGAGIEQVFAGNPDLLAFKNNFEARSKVLGPRWLSPQVKIAGKEKAENLPEPQSYRIPGNGEALIQKLADCQKNIFNDGLTLATLVRESQEPSQGDAEAVEQLNQTTALAKILVATGVAMERENKQIAHAASLTFPSANPSPLSAWRYQDGKWRPDKTDENHKEKKEKIPLTNQQKNELNKGIRQLDALRYNIEKNVAQGRDDQLKQLVSDEITPLLRRQLQELVTQLGTDPREAVYQPFANLNGNDQQAVAEGLKVASQVQMNLLTVVPDTQTALIASTLSSLQDLRGALGQNADNLPGLSAKDAKVRV
ncbi:hypothetical protein [Varibaculum vaginae]|uniref:hypothetical protein n=1 Tax=Varibaculum vaginae TaxID=2364797 RepID=UPI000F07A5D4|nr:hypothetical protein [Varibaculum vaginae]